MIRVIASTATQPIRHATVEEIPGLLESTDNSLVLWVDLENPTDEEERLMLEQIFRFHPLAVQDCRHQRESQRDEDHLPKVEDYEHYLFCIINPIIYLDGEKPNGEKPNGEKPNTPPTQIASHNGNQDGSQQQPPPPRRRVSSSGHNIHTGQLNTFLGERYIVTHHYYHSPSIQRAIAHCERNPGSVKRGPDYLYHIILHDIVDQYAVTLDQFDAEMDKLETEVFHASSRRTLAHILAMKRRLFQLRRITSYQREMVSRLARGEFDLIADVEIAYYRNVYDHLVRASELAESYRDVVTGLLDGYLSMNSNRMNEIMKVLTLFSTFFLPLTFIAGVYGMNFHFMPELEWPYGYLFAWGVMAVTAVGMFSYFRRKRWL
ncbi:MAG: magnesium/cobalt transporter CorA [Chlorobi bacterium]|nr:magnesium/cobalt transporter CorA [Chlorobiota bacterium]